MSMKFYLFLLLVISVTSDNINDDHDDHTKLKSRSKRGAFWDFFQKIAITTNLAYDQYNDTKTTLNEIYNLIDDGFTDRKPKRPPTTTTRTSSPDTMMDDDGNSEMSTTTERYRISRYELGRILGRNFRGLKRLLQIEINDALNQSTYNIAEYKREGRMQFSNSIIAGKKDALKGFQTNTNSTRT